MRWSLLTPALLARPLGLLGLTSLAALACDSSLFKPPDTSVVGQTLGTMLAVSYAASLTQHALTVGTSPCYATTLSGASAVNTVSISVTPECGFPFPGNAEGNILVAGLAGGAGAPTLGVADFSGVRVDGRALPITHATGYLLVSPADAPAHGIQQQPDSSTLLQTPTNPLFVIFANMEFTASAGADQIDGGRIDEWFGLIDRGATPDDFSDDGYWFGGQRATVTPTSGNVAQEFVAFSPTCRANPQAGAVQIARASELVTGTGIDYLAFVPECEGAGYVVLSLSTNLLSVGQHAPVDFLAPQ